MRRGWYIVYSAIAKKKRLERTRWLCCFEAAPSDLRGNWETRKRRREGGNSIRAGFLSNALALKLETRRKKKNRALFESNPGANLPG